MRKASECEHRLIADALVVAAGKVLLVKYRDTEDYDGESGWFVPDDFLNEPERPEEAARRILEDQVGVRLKAMELGFIESFSHGKWHLIFHYKARLAKTPRVKMSPKLEAAEWFKVGNLPPRKECAHKGWAHDIVAKALSTSTA